MLDAERPLESQRADRSAAPAVPRWSVAATPLAARDAWATLAVRLRGGASPVERSRRIVVLLCAIWLLNVVDLVLTLSESRRHLFIELNPVARWVLALPPAALVVYKTTLVAAGSWILLACARHRVAELACWLLLAAYVNVTLQWSLYYFHFLLSLSDPAVNFDPWTGITSP